MDVTQLQWSDELRFLVALALGFLIGLERESTKVDHKFLFLGGVRTFPIVSMLGFGCGWLHRLDIPFVLTAGLVAIGALTVVAYTAKIKTGRFGSTSEVSLLLSFVAGALALLADIWIPMTLAIVTTLLLSEKAELEKYVERLDRVGFLATLRFLIVTVIILPVLPDQEYTRFHLNPALIWKMVILVSTVGYVGYLLSKRFGQEAGLWLSGVVGGIVSSTAVSIFSGRLARRNPGRSAEALRAALLAGSTMYLRLLTLVLVINPQVITALWWKLLALACVGAALALTQRTSASPSTVTEEAPEIQNPFEMKPALIFAALFVGLSILTTLLIVSLGESGITLLSFIVGVVDISPFVLSIIQNPDVPASLVSKAVIIATASNTLAKGAYFGFLSGSARGETFMRYGLWALLHIPLVLIP